tara:strand:+ start:16257 stop:16370 length:114 start_codon:yes stop_codon:yes gene_type:complete
MLRSIAATVQFFLRVVVGLCLGLVLGAVVATALPIYI